MVGTSGILDEDLVGFTLLDFSTFPPLLDDATCSHMQVNAARWLEKETMQASGCLQGQINER